MNFRPLLLLLALTTLTSCKNGGEKDLATTNNEEITTYYLIRHSEKDRSDSQNSNPNLNPNGKERAERWASYFNDKKIDAVYSTNYNRTIQTATPTADAYGLEVKFYDPTNMYDQNFVEETTGKNILVVGHSNTTPQFVNAILGERKYNDLDDNDNATLFIVKKAKDTTTVEQKKIN